MNSFSRAELVGKPYLVKIGLMGVVGRYDSPDYRRYARDESVICRTQRGLEAGTVLCDLEVSHTIEPETQGELLRSTSSDDQMILQRLQRHRDRAFDACDALLKKEQITATLMDVEHLFDGQSIFFYFLGEVPEKVHAITKQLSEVYEQKVKFRKFAEALAEGCGPGCGTTASKCGSSEASGCSSCGMSGRCGS